MNDRLRALWRDQEARHPEPPTPALVDALYEAGEDELAWRLHWCREWGVVPVRRVLHGDVRYYVWNHEWVQRRVGEEVFKQLLGLGRRYSLWATHLHRTYAIPLRLPREVFPCK